MDGLVNMVTAIGTSRDKRTHAWFYADIVSETLALQLWRSNDICRRVIEAAPKAAFRRGVRIKVEDKDQSERVGAALEDLELVEKFIQACCYENAYGGAAIYPVVQDAGSLEEPLDENATFSNVIAYHVLEPRELTPASFYTDINDPNFRKPKTWTFIPSGTNALISMQQIHESRLIIFPGKRVSNRLESGQRPGFGDSRLNGAWELVRDYAHAWGNTGAILADFAAGTLAMEGYSKLMKEKGGEAVVRARMRVFSEFLSSIRMGVMDKQDTYSRSTTPLGGLSDILHDYAVRISAAAEQPVTVLFGMSPAGLNATGDNDVRAWYDTVAAWREHEIKRRFERAVEIYMLGQDSWTNGVIPEVWSIEFPPLWEPSEKEQAETRKTIAETDQIYYTMGAADAGTIAESRWGGDTYSGEMHIDWAERDAQAKAADDMAEQAKNAELAGTGAVDPITGQPIAVMPGASGALPGASDVQKQALSGVQVDAMLEIVERMTMKKMPRKNAIAALVFAFPTMTIQQAEEIMPAEDFTPAADAPKPNPFGGGGGGPPIPPKTPPPPDDGESTDQPAEDAKAA
jgi:phage-related protein (TIGR01555 family)